MTIYTSQKLLDAIARRAFLPTNQATFTDSEILNIADEVLSPYMLGIILQQGGDHYVTAIDVSVTANTNTYSIPSRAIGSGLREVKLQVNDYLKDLQKIDISQISLTQTGEPTHFYLKNDQLVLYPTPSSSYTLKLHVQIHPGSLVETTSTAVISAIDTNTNIVTVSSIPSTWVTGDTFDFVSKNGSHAYVSIDQTSTLVDSNNITFSSLPSNLVVGDYVSVTGETSLVQVPNVFRSVLVQGVTAQILSSTGQSGSAKAEKKFEDMLQAASSLIQERVTGELEDVLPTAWR